MEISFRVLLGPLSSAPAGPSSYFRADASPQSSSTSRTPPSSSRPTSAHTSSGGRRMTPRPSAKTSTFRASTSSLRSQTGRCVAVRAVIGQSVLTAREWEGLVTYLDLHVGCRSACVHTPPRPVSPRSPPVQSTVSPSSSRTSYCPRGGMSSANPPGPDPLSMGAYLALEWC